MGTVNYGPVLPARPQTGPYTCYRCYGMGQVCAEVMGGSVGQPCPVCRGTGRYGSGDENKEEGK